MKTRWLDFLCWIGIHDPFPKQKLDSSGRLIGVFCTHCDRKYQIGFKRNR